MFDLISLPIFPVDSASVTLTTTVWIGVLVAVFFNLKFGWNLSALVVPGYLVPLLISRPTTALVIFTEAILTYLLARWLSDAFKRLPWWSSFFGRDRFFVIVVVSVIVRSVCDGWILPGIGQYIVNEIGWSFDYRNELQSFGLIIVALIANYFWKPGIVRGFIPITICIAVTFVIINYFLGALTNINLANFNLMYEDISASLLASPKSYIILICTAYLASWINLRYAWDFNGILIPALMGMMLYDPMKILASCAECVLIFSLGSLLLRAPYIREIGMQGARKLLFFFTVCFGLRLMYAHAIPLFFEAAQVTDVFGLGYLLSTLMAVKAHDKQLMIRMLKGTLQVSLVGGIAGSLIGFLLYCWSGTLSGNSIAAVVSNHGFEKMEVVRSDQTIFEMIRQSKPLLYEKKEAGSYQVPTYSELTTFRSALNDIKRLGNSFRPSTLSAIAKKLSLVNYSITISADEKIFLSENHPANGWGLYAIDPMIPSGLCLEVPAPLDEWATFESGLSLMSQFSTRALAIAGAGKTTNLDGTSDVTLFKATMFSEFHKTFGTQETVQIRSKTGPLWRNNQPKTLESNVATRSELFIASSLPQSMPLEELKQTIGDFQVHWSASPFQNKVSRSNQYAELVLTKPVRRRLLVMSHAETGVSPNVPSHDDETVGVSGMNLKVPIVRKPLSAFLEGIKENIYRQDSERFEPAKLEELLFMDHEVVGPLIDLAGETQPDRAFKRGDEGLPQWLNKDKIEKLHAIQIAAQAIGCQVSVILDPNNGDQVYALSASANMNKGWGTYIFRPGLMDSIAVEIPRPLLENRSFDFGASLFQRPRASALLIAGAHPRANADGSADISKSANRKNLFNLVRQVLFRKLGKRPFLLCQARAIQAPVESDIVLAFDEGETTFEELSPLKKWFAQQLIDDEFSIGFVNGSPDTAGYELGILMKAASFQVSQNKEIVSLWLSPSLRTKYRQQDENSSLIAQMKACEIDVVFGNLTDELQNRVSLPNNFLNVAHLQSLPTELKQQLNTYVERFDIIKLLTTKQQFPNWKLKCVQDSVSGQTFLAVYNSRGQLSAVANLTGFIGTETITAASHRREVIQQYVESRKLWLEVTH
ncbi:poly-gamma-glutamate biosynthesis protein PgsC/CapC [bacterium]|nr:poly-gamma-glutamate biosynthesis protein PgsC/CapC [bacterium]